MNEPALQLGAERVEPGLLCRLERRGREALQEVGGVHESRAVDQDVKSVEQSLRGPGLTKGRDAIHNCLPSLYGERRHAVTGNVRTGGVGGFAPFF